MPDTNGNTRIGSFNFSDALAYLKSGNFLTREGWNGRDQYIAVQNPDQQSANKAPYIWIMPTTGKRVPWVASQGDLFAEDWQIYPKPPVGNTNG